MRRLSLSCMAFLFPPGLLGSGPSSNLAFTSALICSAQFQLPHQPFAELSKRRRCPKAVTDLCGPRPSQVEEDQPDAKHVHRVREMSVADEPSSDCAKGGEGASAPAMCG